MPAARVLEPYLSLAAFFGAEVRRHRCRMDWTQQELAERVPGSDALVAKVERGERLPPDTFGAACDREFGLPGVLAQLEALTRAAPSWFVKFVELEGRATRISVWDMRLVPGLLQTEDYAWAVIEANGPRMSGEQVAEATAKRLARQAILHRPVPPALAVLLDESVVRRGPAGGGVLRDQLAHLYWFAQRPEVTLRVLPFVSGSLAGTTGPFYLLEFDDQPPVGYAEGSGSGRIIDGAELSGLSLLYDRIGAAALTADQTGGLLLGAMGATWSFHP